MSSGPEGLIRAAEAAFNDRAVEAFVELVHPDIEWEAGLLGTPTYHGQDGVRQMLRDVEAAWQGMETKVKLVAARGPVLVVEWRMKALGRTSGAPIEGRQFVTVELKDGRAIRVRAFQTSEEALDAAGLKT